MTYSKAKLKSSGDKTSSSFRPFWIGKLSQNYWVFGLLSSSSILENRKLNVSEMFTHTDFAIHFV
jgi:hypothetical protein